MQNRHFVLVEAQNFGVSLSFFVKRYDDIVFDSKPWVVCNLQVGPRIVWFPCVGTRITKVWKRFIFLFFLAQRHNARAKATETIVFRPTFPKNWTRYSRQSRYSTVENLREKKYRNTTKRPPFYSSHGAFYSRAFLLSQLNVRQYITRRNQQYQASKEMIVGFISWLSIRLHFVETNNWFFERPLALPIHFHSVPLSLAPLDFWPILT